MQQQNYMHINQAVQSCRDSVHKYFHFHNDILYNYILLVVLLTHFIPIHVITSINTLCDYSQKAHIIVSHEMPWEYHITTH